MLLRGDCLQQESGAALLQGQRQPRETVVERTEKKGLEEHGDCNKPLDKALLCKGVRDLKQTFARSLAHCRA